MVLSKLCKGVQNARDASQAHTVGSARSDWSEIGFRWAGELDLHHSTFRHADGQWDSGEVTSKQHFEIHVMAQVLHYGQSIFEGLKAMQRKDGSVVVMNIDDHAARFQRSAEGLLMPQVSTDMFRKAVEMTVMSNLANIPPYGSGGSLYLRPLMVGDAATLGLHPSTTYFFKVLATPVGSYYASGKMESQAAKVMLEHDRAAPKGLGQYKCSANYIADLRPLLNCKKDGFPMGLYLDPKDRVLIEEFNTSNFVAITHDDTYVPFGEFHITPKSDSVLGSVTNLRLQQLAKDMGLRVEIRPINFLQEVESFREVCGVGTAVVIAPVKSITHENQVFVFSEPKIFTSLYNKYIDICLGAAEDEHGWGTVMLAAKATERG